ncbi:MAG TPA: S8 family serine peptidase [Gemmatimonadaceae bacterium]|nr:S8 family serine peptidase [Gemmatimonadaceae bacterium]
MHYRPAIILALAAFALASACKDQSAVPHTPTHLSIVSGTNQSGDLAAPLAQPLIVQALDGANKAVAGVPLTWTAIGGGALSATTSTTDKDGKSSVTWTLAPVAGVQVVTVTSSSIGNASVSFVASNGPMISGTVTSATTGPYFGANLSRSPGRSPRLSAAPTRTITRHPSPDRIIVGFRNTTLGVASAGSGAYRSISVARATTSLIRERLGALSSQLHLSHAQVSPAILAARVRVDDTTQIAAVMDALRNDPNVAWVERDQIVSIRDGAPKPMSTDFVPATPSAPSGGPVKLGSALVPTDPGYFEQTWAANMVDLPRAWSLTTGSPNVIVASVDMGIRFDDPDVAANLTSDGYDFVSQVAFDQPQQLCDGSTFTTIDGDGDGPDPDPTDPDDLEFDQFFGCWNHAFLGDHGLWTAGIIGSVGNDGIGGAGVAWNVKIRPIRVLGITGEGTNFDIAQGVLYAAGLPAAGPDSTTPVQAPSRAQIISMSLGGGRSAALEAAVTAATDAGSLVVASAGNDGLDFPVYPAAYPGVMAVGAVGMDGTLATYSNAGTFISVTAPGGDFRLDDNGGGGIYGPGWDFVNDRPVHLFGYGTSASAPYVAGIAALLLAQQPTLTGTQLRSRIEQYATRTPGLGRSDTYGWGIVNAYNALTSTSGGQHQTFVRLVDATTGQVAKTAPVAANGNFALTRLQAGAYYLQAGDDDNDGQIGVPGRRFSWAGGAGRPTVFNVNANAQAAAISLGVPTEVEPNDDASHANQLSVGSYVIGTITPPDTRDVYSVTIPASGTYTIETSGVVGSCGLGVELDTFIQVVSAAGATIGTNDNFPSPTGHFCSRVQATLTAGIYYVSVGGNGASGLASHGRYRLEVRAGT